MKYISMSSLKCSAFSGNSTLYLAGANFAKILAGYEQFVGADKKSFNTSSTTKTTPKRKAIVFHPNEYTWRHRQRCAVSHIR
ncbi:MAG: hypothetical protein ACYC9J_13155 [Sulfuricaulis sp.]